MILQLDDDDHHEVGFMVDQSRVIENTDGVFEENNIKSGYGRFAVTYQIHGEMIEVTIRGDKKAEEKGKELEIEANTHINNDDLQDAIDTLEQAMKANPNRANEYEQRRNLIEREKQWVAQIAALIEALDNQNPILDKGVRRELGFSIETYLILKNETNLNITNIVVNDVNSTDWDDIDRPDHKFTGVTIRAGESLQHRLEINRLAQVCRYSMDLRLENGLVVGFGANQRRVTVGGNVGFEENSRKSGYTRFAVTHQLQPFATIVVTIKKRPE
jgi:hypothetical protein